MPVHETPVLVSPDAAEMAAAQPRALSEISRAEQLRSQLPWLLAWGAKGSLAMADQALFAGAQFVLNVLLARWLDPAGYGVFAVAYSVCLLAIAVHSALLVEPMVVFGSARYLEERGSYLAAVLRGHSLLMMPIACPLFAAGLAAGRWNSPTIGHSFYALGLALPLTLLSDLTRRAFYIEMRPGRAATGGAIYFASLMSLIYGLRTRHFLTPATAILAMGAAALLTASVQLSWLKSRWPPPSEVFSAKDVAFEHWEYGKWVLAAAFPSWTFPNLFYLVLPLRYGLKESGALKAIMNLAMPATHAMIALGVLTIALLVRHRNVGGLPLMRLTVRRITGLFVAAAVAYFVVLWLFRVPIIHVLYGRNYAEYSGLPVLLVALAPLVTAWSVSSGVALRSVERPDRLFWANLIAGAVAATLGLSLTVRWGVLGAIAGHLASYAVLAGALWFFYLRLATVAESDG